MEPFILKYRINGITFRRGYATRAARDSRADVLATRGIFVVCKHF